MNSDKKIPDKFLPLGTVCILKNTVKRVMITGYLIKQNENDTPRDYLGCLYPEGILQTNQNFAFNHDQIQSIFFVGYDDTEFKLFNKRLLDIEKNL